MPKNHRGFGTRAVHAGEGVRPSDFTPVASPIHPSVGFVYDSMDELDAIFGSARPGFVYPRYGSPTVAAFEEAMADLEGGEAAFALASGMAAIHVALLAAGVRAGTGVVAALDLYGATTTLLERLMAALGVTVRFVDVTDLAAVEAALSEARPAAFLAEIISNPLLKVADVPALTDLAHRYGAPCLIDNTFATPFLFRPHAAGADYVIHSATKYIGGHGDVMAGVIVCSADNRSKLYETNKLVGSVLGPFEAWLALRGVKTLPLRMRQQCASAKAVAEWLATREGIACVNYPGLPSHPQHEVARRLFGERGFGGMVSFEIAGADKAKVFRFMEALELCLPATTLGDVYSLVLHPATTSHRSLTPEERGRVGIRDGLARLSVGIEDVEDIIADLNEALNCC